MKDMQDHTSKRPITCELFCRNIKHDQGRCPYGTAHNIQTCSTCQVVLASPKCAESHYNGAKHKKKSEQAGALKIGATLLENLSKRESLKISLEKARQLNCDPIKRATIKHNQPNGNGPCSGINKCCVESKMHINDNSGDSFGIILTPSSNELNIRILKPDSDESRQCIRIINQSSVPVLLVHITSTPSSTQPIILLQHPLKTHNQNILPGGNLEVWIKLTPRLSSIGICERTFNFHFTGPDNFIISRTIKCTMGEQSIRNTARSGNVDVYKPFLPNRSRILAKNTTVIKGKRPKTLNPHISDKRPLPHFPVNQVLKEIVVMMTRGAAENKQARLLAKNHRQQSALSLKQVESRLRHGLLKVPRTMKSFKKYWHTVLDLEEIQMAIDMDQYTLENTPIEMLASRTRSNGLHAYTIDVPGLAEKRPSIVYGDIVRLQLSRQTNDSDSPHKSWEGYVIEIRNTDLTFQVSKHFDIRYSAHLMFDISFSFNRKQLRRIHSAIEGYGLHNTMSLFSYALMQCSIENHSVNINSDAVFSQLVSILNTRYNTGKLKLELFEQKKVAQRELYNNGITENPEQLDAVTKIRFGVHHPMPFILFGPPGTGKTMTLVESISQLARNPKHRILVCTPSNDAADLFITRLSRYWDSNVMFRLNAVGRGDLSNLPKEVQNYSRINGVEDFYQAPQMEHLMQFRIIVSTCIAGGFLHELGAPDGYFSHIFVDEAGQTTECEAGVAISNFVHTNSRIILTGDPKQLGPIILSSLAKLFGLKTSFLEHYMNVIMTIHAKCHSNKKTVKDISIYTKMAGMLIDNVPKIDCIVPLLFTKLLQNYRSHEVILKLPNFLFYENELKVCAPINTRNRFSKWVELPRQGYPIMFQHVIGKNEREGSSPSWFNMAEINAVKTFIQKLKLANCGDKRVTDKDIGIITPYQRQVQKIRKMVASFGYAIKVGSVETFQGQERPVIIVSTVRSSMEHVATDLRFNLGFLSDPKRFNVAITRAESLLIFVGDCNVLWHDKYWRKLLDMLLEVNAIVGWSGAQKSDL